MTLGRLVRRSLSHYRQTSLLVLLGLMVASAVITGSLVIGDSMRGSLRDAALSRLGLVSDVLIAPRLFRETLADDLHRSLPGTLACALQTTGAAANAESDATIPGVTVWGVSDDFWSLHPRAVVPSLSDRSVALNATLARDLGVQPGGSVLLTLNKPAQLGADSIFGHRGRADIVATLRVTVATILPDNGCGDFRLDAQSARPRNVFISRAWLAESLGQPGKANVLLAATEGGPDQLAGALEQVVTLADYGLSVKPKPGGLSVSSDSLTLSPDRVESAQAAAKALHTEAHPWLVYLATRLRTVAAPRRQAAYSVIAGLDSPRPFAFKSGGGTVPAEGEVWLNEWLAVDLQARVGQSVDLDYLVPSGDGNYPTRTLRLRVGGIVAISGPAADPTIMPEYKGLTDAATLGEWKPPFPVDMSLITPRDDQYWERYRATPKAFLNFEQMQRMWREAAQVDAESALLPLSGWQTTSLDLPLPAGAQAQALARAFAAELTKQLAAPRANANRDLIFTPIRKQALAASQGTSDFGGLFLGLSMFLVAAGAALAGMLLRLSLERRAGQMGLMLATGLPERLVMRSLFAEGAALTVAGTALGVPAGVAYAAVLLSALSGWWRGALGFTPQLWLHVTPLSLAIGVASGLIVGLLTTRQSLRGLLKRPVLSLLAGWQALREPTQASVGRLRFALVASVLLVVILLILGLWARQIDAVGAFFAIGFLLLVTGLLAFRLGFALAWRRKLGQRLSSLAWRNAAANYGRSLLVIGLLAGATFMIVAVAANTRDLSRLDTRDKRSGTGGYSLVATSTVPLTYDLATPKGRENLGVAPEDEPLLAQCQIVSMLASPGEDISCLNLSRPQSPRLLGMPRDFEQSLFGGKRFWVQQTDVVDVHPRIAAVGDADSVLWSLHSGLNQRYETQAAGRKVTLWFHGTVAGSIFARELLVSETDFRRLFPAITSPSYFLIETPSGQEQAVADALRRNLGDLGLEVKTTGEVLSEFGQVQNTYLSMFLALGGLGLALGTLGMIVVILRSVLERRRELALMAATGFDASQLARLLLLEHGGLLLAGLGIGTVSALIAVAPQLGKAATAVNWGALAATLAATLVVGLVSCLWAVRTALRGNLLAALRSE